MRPSVLLFLKDLVLGPEAQISALGSRLHELEESLRSGAAVMEADAMRVRLLPFQGRAFFYP